MGALKASELQRCRDCQPEKVQPEHTNNVANSAGRRVWGYLGIEALVRPEMPSSSLGIKLYMGELGLFAMYVCTSSSTHVLAKTLNRTINATFMTLK